MHVVWKFWIKGNAKDLWMCAHMQLSVNFLLFQMVVVYVFMVRKCSFTISSVNVSLSTVMVVHSYVYNKDVKPKFLIVKNILKLSKVKFCV